MDLALIWAGIIAFGVTLYVLLDGFSLGIGILFPFAHSDEERGLMMASVAPVWDGNQTWLVLGGASLFAAFPKAFNLLLSALYLPLIVMLIALVFRGAAFEFRGKAAEPRLWNWAFAGGALTAAFCQGLVLGTYVLGFEIQDGVAQGGAFLWLSPFSLATGFAVVAAYAMLGACWLIIKTEGDLQAWARSQAQGLFWPILGFIALVSIWTPLADAAIADRWFSWPNLILLAPVPILTTGVAGALYLALRSNNEHAPFLLLILLYLLTLSGLTIGLWPYILPRELTVWDAAAQWESLLFLLAGVAVIIPVVLLYTTHAYYVFRGKVSAETAYH